MSMLGRGWQAPGLLLRLVASRPGLPTEDLCAGLCVICVICVCPPCAPPADG